MSVIWGHFTLLCFYVNKNSLRKSNILLLSNNIPLLSLNLLSSHWGPPDDVSSVVALGESLVELYITRLYIALLKVYKKKHFEGNKCSSVFLEEAAAWCVLDTVGTEVSLSVFRAGPRQGHGHLLRSTSQSPGSFSIKTRTHTQIASCTNISSH